MIVNLTNDSPDDGVGTLTITSTIQNDSSITTEFQKEIMRMCNETVVADDVRRCVLDVNNIADYLDYTYSIAFTIGKL